DAIMILPAEESVVSGTPVEGVLTAEPADDVVTVRTHQRVIAGCSLDRAGGRSAHSGSARGAQEQGQQHDKDVSAHAQSPPSWILTRPAHAEFPRQSVRDGPQADVAGCHRRNLRPVC